MKTAIRIIENQFGNNEYRHMYLQILVQRSKDYDSLEVAGTLHWQSDRKRDQEVKSGVSANPWYGLTFQVDTDRAEHLAAMAKIAKHVKDNTYWDAQPAEVFQLLGGVEYTCNDGDFIPRSYKGMHKFKVMRNDTEYYNKIYAPNEIIASKKLEKMQKDAHGTLKLVNAGVFQG
jgi:hypothetical protein